MLFALSKKSIFKFVKEIPRNVVLRRAFQNSSAFHQNEKVLATNPKANSNTFLIKMAQDGNPKEQYELGMNYLSGSNGFEKDFDSSRKWLTEASAQGFLEAEAQMGKMLLGGIAVKKSLPDAFRHFFRAASKGHSESMATLGNMLLNGIGTAKDTCEAFKWLTKAAKLQNYRAMCDLGLMYADGSVPSKESKNDYTDHYIATRLAERAGNAQGGLKAKSQLLAGKLRARQHDLELAKEWFLKSANGGDVEAMTCYGQVLFQNNDKIAVSPAEAKRACFLIEKAAGLGNKKAQRDLGFILAEEDFFGIKRDMKRSVFNLATAGLFGMPDAFLRLAEIHAEGPERYGSPNLIRTDLQKARDYVKDARKTARENELATLETSVWHVLWEDPRKIRVLIDRFEISGGKRNKIWIGNLENLKCILADEIK